MSDADEFAEFVAARSAALLRTAYLLTGDRQDAEDLVQAALIKVVPRWGRLREPEPYVRRILVNESISRWRRRRWRETRVPEVRDAAAPGHDVDQQLVLRQALAPARAATAGGDRAALLRRPHRGADRRGARDLGRHREVAGARRLARLRTLVPDLAEPALSERPAGAPTPP